MRQSAEPKPSVVKEHLNNINTINIDSNEVLGKHESEAIVRMIEKGSMPAQIDDIND